MDGIPALDLWDLVTDVLHSNPNQKEKFKKEREDPFCCKTSEKQVKSQCNTQVSQKHTEGPENIHLGTVSTNLRRKSP